MQYLVPIHYKSGDEFFLRDLLARPEVSLFYVSKPLKNPLLHKIRRVHTSTVATKYFEPPLKSIWYEKDLMAMIPEDQPFGLIFQISSMLHIGLKTLRRIRAKYPKVRFILLLVDSMHASSWSMQYAKRYIRDFGWDLILSFDKSDCEEFGFTYIGMSYYTMLDKDPEAAVENDLYYIGALKKEEERLRDINDTYSWCSGRGVNCAFTVLTGMQDAPLAEGINGIRTPITYEEVIREVQRTNCILELVQKGQSNQTLRYMEAICYNKKLLTNNPGITELPYYDPRYMKIFENPSDIDTEWVKAREDVDFQYKGDFSPAHLLDIIEEKFAGR